MSLPDESFRPTALAESCPPPRYRCQGCGWTFVPDASQEAADSMPCPDCHKTVLAPGIVPGEWARRHLGRRSGGSKIVAMKAVGRRRRRTAEFDSAQRGSLGSLMSPSDRWLLRCVCGAMVLFLASGVAYLWRQRGRPTLDEVAAPQLAAQPTTPRLRPVSSPQLCETVIKAFFAAKSVEEKIPLLIQGASIREEVERHYRQYPLESTHVLARVELCPTSEDDDAKGIVRAVVHWGDQGRTVTFLKRSGLGLQLDWPTYRQEREASLQTFVHTPTSSPHVFRLALLPCPAKEEAIPVGEGSVAATAWAKWRVNLATLSGEALSVQPRLPLANGVAAQIAEGLHDRPGRYATVELAWHQEDVTPQVDPQSPPQTPTLFIRRLVCWELLDLGQQVADVRSR